MKLSNRSIVNENGPAARCPICGTALQPAPAIADYRPFCSKRCADVDLHRWLAGSYAIPAVESDDDRDLSCDEN